jgi:hypothetical protein
VALQTAPPRKLAEGFKIGRRKPLRDRGDIGANCTHAGMEISPFDD